MKRNGRIIRKAVAGVVLCGGLAGASAALAGPFAYDVRFTDGTNTKTISTAGVYQVDVWVRVTGTNSNLQDDGLSHGYLNLRSSQTNGGAMVGAGDGLANPNLDLFDPPLGTGTRPFPFDAGFTRDGSGSDLNADGVEDWGSNSTQIIDTGYMLWGTAGSTEWGGGRMRGGSHGVGQAQGAGWEWKVGSFNVNVSVTGMGATRFSVVEPVGRLTTGLTSFLAGYVDGAQLNADASNDQGVFTVNDLNPTMSHDIVFLTPRVPEPGWMTIAMAALLAAGRRRRD